MAQLMRYNQACNIVLKNLQCRPYTHVKHCIKNNIHILPSASIPRLQCSCFTNSTIISPSTLRHYLNPKLISHNNIILNNYCKFLIVKSLTRTYSSDSDLHKNITKVQQSIESNLPSQKQLENIEKIMKSELSEVFVSRHEYRMYTKDVEFENKWNFFETKSTKGLLKYALQIMRARFIIHLCYPKVKVTILNSTLNPARGSVRIKWKIDVLQQSKIFSIKSLTLAGSRRLADALTQHFEIESTFYVNVRGFIYRHKLERIISKDKD